MRSSSETENVSRPPTSAERRSCVSRVRRSNAVVARSSRLLQPFACARASASARSGDRRARRARAAALARSARPRVAREGRERPPDGGTADVVRVEELAHGLPERARLARRALVADRLADEHEPPPRPRAGGGEEVAVAARGVGSHEARAADARRARAASRRRGTVASAARRGSAPCSSPITKTVSKRRVRARRRSSTATRPGSPARSRADGRPLERREDVVAAERDARRADRLELVERAGDGVVRPQVAPRPLVERRRSSSRARCAASRPRAAATASSGLARQRARSSSGSGRPSRSSDRHVDRAVAPQDAAAAQASLDPVDVPAREARVRGAQERVELRPLAVAPGEAEQGEQRVPERRRAERDAALERERDAERSRRPPRARAARARRTGRRSAISSGGDAAARRARAPRRRRARACARARRPRGTGSTRRAGCATARP